MSFNLPSFNLPVNIWHAPPTGFSALPTSLPDLQTMCSLVALSSKYADAVFTQGVVLLFPALTDIRTPQNNPPFGNDLVECPAGSGRWYSVFVVDDSGKGHPNEHRYAVARWAFVWPVPIP